MRLHYYYFVLAFFCSTAHAEKILLLGDSLSAAYGMDWEQGWVQLLTEELKGEHEVINASVSGETTGGGLARLPTLLQEHQPDRVIIELGGNDGLRGYPLGVIRKNLTKMGQLVEDDQRELMYLAIRIPPNYGQRYTEAFAAIYQDVAEEFQVPYLNLYSDSIALDATMMQKDKLHPTRKAQPLLKNAVRDFLLEHM